MHAELAKLLDLQTKDTALEAVEGQVDVIRHELGALDAALAQARASAAAARQAVTDAVRRRDELESKIEHHRAAQAERQQRLDQVRKFKEANAAMAELERAGSAQAKEEGEWVRSAEQVEQAERQAGELEQQLATAEAAQQPERKRLGVQLRGLEKELDSARQQREATAALIDRSLRIRYDRLRGTRTAAVVVPLVGSTCGGCFTAVPLHRRTRIRSGQAIDGCEACGAILYPPAAE